MKIPSPIPFVEKYCRNQLFLSGLTACAFQAIFFTGALHAGPPSRGPEPVTAYPAYAVVPLKATADTSLLIGFDAQGTPVTMGSAGLQATLVGQWQPVPMALELPGFSGAVQIVAESKKPAQLKVKDGAALLSQGSFTIDVIMRFSQGDDHFLEAGEGTAFLWGLLDRNAGVLEVYAPNKDGTVIRSEMPGALEKAGPLRRNAYQLLTLTYDEKGQFVFYIDGIRCLEFGIDGVAGKLALKDGPLLFGQVSRGHTTFVGALAQLRVQSGVHAPDAPKPLNAVGPGALAFDMGPLDTPVEPGYTQVTTETVLQQGGEYGWMQPTKGEVDFWFVGDRYWAKPEVATKRGARRTRSWLLRDGVLMPSGGEFVVQVPAGIYEVTVSTGSPDKNQYVTNITANGVTLGTELITLPDDYANSDDRTVRGLVSVKGNEALTISAESKNSEPVSLMAVTVQPVAPLPVSRKEGKLVWMGQGSAPAGFEAVANAYAAGQRDEAWKLTAGIHDVIAQATARAWIVGYPDLTDKVTLERLEVIYDELLGYLRQHPDDLAANYLLQQTYLMWHAALAYIFQQGTTHIYGAPKGRVWREGLNLALQIAPGEPYYGHAQTLAGNFIWQYGQQSGGYVSDTEWRKPSKHRAYAPPPPIFRHVLEEYPDAGLPKIFLGSATRSPLESEKGLGEPLLDYKVPVGKEIVTPDGAPEWAVLQHRALVRLVDLINYWYTERMVADGTMGGGLGDDVEMMRWWKTAIVVADDQQALDGWTRLANTAWRASDKKSMDDTPDDAEHESEDFSDSHALLPLLVIGTPKEDEYAARSRGLIEVLPDNLMGVNPEGYLMFKSHVYSRLGPDPRDGDAPYNIRTMLPLINYAYLHPEDKEVTDVVVAYARNWRDMTMTEIDGKPAGITPMMILFDRSSIILKEGKKNRDWVFPGYASYEYPGGYTDKIYDLLIAAYELTGDESFLDPHRKALEFLGTLGEGDAGHINTSSGGMTTHIASEASGDYDSSQYPRGSLEWAIRINRAGLAKAGAKYRLVTGDTSYDETLLKHGPAYTRFQILAERAQNPQQMADAVAALEPYQKDVLGTLDYNELLRTKLPLSTDRVWVPGMDFVESISTGDVSQTPPPTMRGEEEAWPLFGVTWTDTGPDVAALVRSNQVTKLDGYVYNFAEGDREIGAHLWRLKPGQYRFQLLSAPDYAPEGAPLVSQDFELKEKGQLFRISVPSKQQCYFSFQRL